MYLHRGLCLHIGIYVLQYTVARSSSPAGCICFGNLWSQNVVNQRLVLLLLLLLLLLPLLLLLHQARAVSLT